MVTELEVTSAEHADCCVLTVAGELDMMRARTIEVALIRHTSTDAPLIQGRTTAHPRALHNRHARGRTSRRATRPGDLPER